MSSIHINHQSHNSAEACYTVWRGCAGKHAILAISWYINCRGYHPGCEILGTHKLNESLNGAVELVYPTAPSQNHGAWEAVPTSYFRWSLPCSLVYFRIRNISESCYTPDAIQSTRNSKARSAWVPG